MERGHMNWLLAVSVVIGRLSCESTELSRIAMHFAVLNASPLGLRASGVRAQHSEG